MKNIFYFLISLVIFFSSGCGLIKIEQIFSRPNQYNGNDKALLIGINKYPTAPLNGCINDVENMKDFLISKHGFKPEQIKILTDNEATTANIFKELDWFVSETNAGDRRLFHYSGHGAQFFGNAEVQNQPNGLNQIICPVDFDWTPEHMIMDVQFKKIFGRFPKGVIFNWVSDSCHSGDLIKNVKIKSRRFPNIPSNILIQIEMVKWYDYRIRSFTDGILDVGFISGSRYDQTSADAFIAGKYRGALTYYFIETAKEYPNKPLSEVVEMTAKKLKKNGYSQVPQAEGSRVRDPFLKGEVFTTGQVLVE